MTTKTETAFVLVLIEDNRDFAVCKTGYCEKCLNKKLPILKIYNITKAEAIELQNYGVKGYNIKCECGIKVI